jgi:hypothetical protein
MPSSTAFILYHTQYHKFHKGFKPAILMSLGQNKYQSEFVSTAHKLSESMKISHEPLTFHHQFSF